MRVERRAGETGSEGPAGGRGVLEGELSLSVAAAFGLPLLMGRLAYREEQPRAAPLFHSAIYTVIRRYWIASATRLERVVG